MLKMMANYSREQDSNGVKIQDCLLEQWRRTFGAHWYTAKTT